MSAIDLINGTNASTALQTTTAAKKKTMGQDDFLTLLTTQLQTQDPFNPVDNTQMIAQMAQFSQVAGIAEINTSLAAMAKSLGGASAPDTASWIGRAALLETPNVAPLADGSYRGEIDLPADASDVTISFRNAAGEIVHSEELGSQVAGTLAFGWDGAGGDGTALTMTVSSDGTTNSAATTRSWTSISAIQSPASTTDARLVTPIGLFAPADALSLG
ncbi:MAG: flagellar hook assembly protein FlgD [Sphingopyxis sp.]